MLLCCFRFLYQNHQYQERQQRIHMKLSAARCLQGHHASVPSSRHRVMRIRSSTSIIFDISFLQGPNSE
jgi:hypothetical protein